MLHISTLKLSNVYNLKHFYERFMRQNLQSRSLKGQSHKIFGFRFFMNHGLGEDDSWEKSEAANLVTPFNMPLMCSLSGDVYSVCVVFLVIYFQ